MIEFKFRIADRVVAVTAMYESTRNFCKSYLCDAPSDFSVNITPSDLIFEQAKSAREDEIEGIRIRKFSNEYLETIAVQRKIANILIDYDTLLFHGSVIAVEGQAYLFTAKSGTGKSTHTRLWREMLGEKAVMVNDDKPFLRITDEGIIACGSPWNGKHGLGNNIQVPLKAICILERGGENYIEKIEPRDALYILMQQSNRPMDRHRMPRYMDLLDKISKYAEFYRLECNVDPNAAKVAYEAMSGKKLIKN